MSCGHCGDSAHTTEQHLGLTENDLKFYKKQNTELKEKVNQLEYELENCQAEQDHENEQVYPMRNDLD
jgi:hypothetical protein